MAFQAKTRRGYNMVEVAGAMQKAIRRGDGKLALYWVTELHESGFGSYAWKRLITISAEDVADPVAREMQALFQQWEHIKNTATKNSNTMAGARLFPAKAAILLAKANKSRDADHGTCLVYDQKLTITDAELEADLAEVRAHREELPDYTFDCHTRAGREEGKTRRDFFLSEHAALKPRQRGLFDDAVEALRLTPARTRR